MENQKIIPETKPEGAKAILPARPQLPPKSAVLGKIQPATKMVRLAPNQPVLPRPAGQRPLVQPPVAQYVGKYRVIKQIGAGGMGAVFLAVHPQMNKQVVIKKLRTDRSSKSLRDRFFREADDLMRLSNPHVVKMYDYFSDRGGDYIVLEYMDGMALDKLLKKQGGKLPVPLAVQIFIDTCHGLRAAHANGIIHRDIKPGNVLLSKRAEVKLADFGIAGREDEKGGGITMVQGPAPGSVPSSDFVTKIGTVLGTPAYMSPEQLEDASSVDRRSDIYSMGVMLYQMLTGEKPFGSEYNETTKEAIKKGMYVTPKRRNGKIPLSIDLMIRKMMSVKKEDRYKRIDEVIRRCEAYMSGFTKKTRLEIRKYAAKSVRDTEATEYPSWKPARKLAMLGAASLILPLLLLCLHGSGTLRATVLRPLYAPVEFTAAMPEGTPPETRLELYRREDGKMLGGPASPRSLPSRDSVSSSGRIYLPAGEYTARLTAGQYAVWQDFSVSGNNPMTINLQGIPQEKQILSVRATVRDKNTGKDLTGKTEISVLDSGKWTPLQNAEITGGSPLMIRASCPGYKEETRTLATSWNETELSLDIGLEAENKE